MKRKERFKIGLAQIQVTDSDIQNLENALEAIDACSRRGVHLIVLPEFWNTPFLHEDIVHHASGAPDLLKKLQKKAASSHVWIVAGTLPWQEGEKIYNRCFILDDAGNIFGQTDKCHLLEVHTSSGGYLERDEITPGSRLHQFDTPFGTLAILICFDIRFPEAARLLCEQADLLIVPAGFNEAIGTKQWNALLCARAIENEVFVAGVNPARYDYGSYVSYGHSLVVGPDGEILAQAESDPAILVAEIDLQKQKRIRSRSPYWNLRRNDLYKLVIPSSKSRKDKGI